MDEAGFRKLVENAPDAIVVSRDGVILYANDAAARLVGCADASELVGQPMMFLDEGARALMRRRIGQMMATGERLVPREYPARRRDGAEITAEIASAVIEMDGKPAVLAYVRDVTERSRLRTQLAHADRLAALGRMAAGVAHEINNPLAFLALGIEALGRRVGFEHTTRLDELRAGVERIAAIVRDLRFFGRDDEEPAGPMDLGAVIEAAERLVQHEIRPRGALTKELGELPPVMGVPRQIEQVFVNIFLNATNALEDRMDGRIVVRAGVEGDRVVVTVEDDGRGVPPEAIDSLFEPFHTTRPVSGGSGLGLSICREIVSRSGGELVATSAVGKGTTMTIRLPRASAAAVADAGVVAPPPRVTDRGEDGARTRVLIVDDESGIVRLLGEALAPSTDVVGETTPARALERILEGPAFDAIVCDVMMPGMTGIDLHERVARERPEMASRFVFICGGTYTPRAKAYIQRVANPLLDKPFRIWQLVEAIGRVTRSGD